MITIYRDLIQGSDEWKAARCGLLTASEMDLVVTAKQLKAVNNDKVRSHLYELAAQRVTEYVEPSYVNDDMLRGLDIEQHVRELYSEHYGEVEEVGFVTNDRWGFVLGASPDGLVGDSGEIQVKGPRQKTQLATIVANEMPGDHLIQVQTGLLVTERKWCDFISYCGGMPMVTIRVHADLEVQAAIVEAATTFHEKLDAIVERYYSRLADKGSRLVKTERRVMQEIAV